MDNPNDLIETIELVEQALLNMGACVVAQTSFTVPGRDRKVDVAFANPEGWRFYTDGPTLLVDEDIRVIAAFVNDGGLETLLGAIDVAMKEMIKKIELATVAARAALEKLKNG